MRITFGRTVVVPISVLVVALAGLSVPQVAVRSVVVIMAVAAIGLVLALTWRGHRAAGTRRRGERGNRSAP